MRTDTEQLFVLGAPRSGTTFLASLLEGTRFGTPVESQFVVKYFQRLPSYDGLSSPESVSRLITDILSERAMMQWKLVPDTDALCEKLKGTSGSAAYARVVDELFLSRRDAWGRTAWGDKTPHYLGNVDVLDTLFPFARYVVIVRDGRDVALSLLNKEWGPNNVFACAEYWARLNAETETSDRLMAQGRLLRLRYEDLVENVESHLHLVADFLNERLSEEEIVRLAGTVSTASVGRWREMMSPRRAALFEAVAGDTLRRFGYETGPNRRPLSNFERTLHRTHDKLRWARFMFSTNVIDGLKIRFLGKEPFAD